MSAHDTGGDRAPGDVLLVHRKTFSSLASKGNAALHSLTNNNKATRMSPTLLSDFLFLPVTLTTHWCVKPLFLLILGIYLLTRRIPELEHLAQSFQLYARIGADRGSFHSVSPALSSSQPCPPLSCQVQSLIDQQPVRANPFLAADVPRDGFEL